VKAAAFAGRDRRLGWVDLPQPRAAAGELVVRVCALGINPDDARPARAPRRSGAPWVPGVDIAGLVVERGPEAGRFALGDPVAALLDSRRAGGFAEFAVVAESAAAALGPLPFPVGAAVPRAALTAWQALRDDAELRPGDRLLINGASGGVGHFAVQLARAEGAAVTAVAGPSRALFLTTLGAQRVLDYTVEDFVTEGGEFEVVFDVIGGREFEDCEEVLVPDGAYVTTRATARLRLAALRAGLDRRLHRPRPRLRVSRVRPDANDLAKLLAAIELGSLRAAIDRVLTVAEGLTLLSAGGPLRAAGKLVVALA
jgi:NADPH:quinone reductase-like Zn-dependent oxidoreductase